MKKILITGANGFLGQHLCFYLSKNNYKAIASSRGRSRLFFDDVIYEEAELTNADDINFIIEKHKPDVIIHNAALSKPDECNNNKQYCLDVNVESTKHLLANAPAFFIYISTDFIFGENGPHEGQRPSFLHWVKNNLEQGKKIKVVSDQLRTPTYVDDICAGIATIIARQANGDFHLAGKDIISPYEMAVTTANVLGLDSSLIENVTSETFPEPVRRAKKSGLVIDKARQELGYEPVSFEEGVRLSFGL